MSNISDNGKKLIEFVSKKVQNNELDNDDLVQLIEAAGAYLNLKTIPYYASEHKMTYNGVKKCRKVIELFNIKFVIDNE